ncbi:hypothetical protein RP20_CCG008282 [Aedes albopictus]|nr:hypothetical protein RP20_CCG008282 [Aedes albopictus]
MRSSSVRVTPAVSASGGTKPKAKAGQDELRCYNCSGKGHISARCTLPRREPGSCFRCGSGEHVIKNCPKPAPRNKDEVALVDEFRQGKTVDNPNNKLNAALSELNLSDQSG